MKWRALVSLACAAGIAASCDSADPASPPSTSAPDAGRIDPGTRPGLTAAEETLAAERCAPEGTFKGLYTDYFGQTAGKPGSCAFGSDCHGTSSASGTRSSGYQCSDLVTCCRTMIGAGLVSPDDPSGGLVSIVRHRVPDGDGGTKVRGIMPKDPTDFVFDEAAIARMEAWIATGGPPAPDPDAGAGAADASDAATD